MSEEAATKPKRRRSRRKLVARLLRLALVAGAGVWIAKKVKQRSSPAEGLWREGLSGNGQAAADNR
ncbi:MAG TPA: hypothetical protein VHA57_04770 [Actinomycetota bacterium]|nr:hypothetical protein [Actinomycetota bacterium]